MALKVCMHVPECYILYSASNMVYTQVKHLVNAQKQMLNLGSIYIQYRNVKIEEKGLTMKEIY